MKINCNNVYFEYRTVLQGFKIDKCTLNYSANLKLDAGFNSTRAEIIAPSIPTHSHSLTLDVYPQPLLKPSSKPSQPNRLRPDAGALQTLDLAISSGAGALDKLDWLTDAGNLEISIPETAKISIPQNSATPRFYQRLKINWSWEEALRKTETETFDMNN